MNASGVLLLLAGVWVLAQLFGGHALERVGILKPQGAKP